MEAHSKCRNAWTQFSVFEKEMSNLLVAMSGEEDNTIIIT